MVPLLRIHHDSPRPWTHQASTMTAVKLGDVIQIDERSYRYGAGTLSLHITQIGDQVRLPDGDWLNAEGLTLRTDGTQADRHPRPAPVRLSAIRILPPPGGAHEHDLFGQRRADGT
ncbi:hypothetical protein [Micromonospora deserti]|uniref:hypothetical protein n=1 Tax=Micromonospora deserti TaxID=2070366 RepID=UPI0011B47C3D|nr:hypothetical protein [Micromonospora deserti]